MMSSPLHSASVLPAPQPLTEALDQAARLIHQYHRFLISGHSSPDGDVSGSTLALAHILWALGKEVILFNVDPLPYNMRFLPGASAYAHSLPPDAAPEVTCLLDCHLRSRAGNAFPAHGWAPRTLIIDHHRLHADPPVADVFVHDPSAAATGELIYRLHKTLRVPLSLPLAECLYTSIVTDTGGFRYSNTSPTALNIAADLIAHGVDPCTSPATSTRVTPSNASNSSPLSSKPSN
jgi:phosphoesterase RecJ-like protein